MVAHSLHKLSSLGLISITQHRMLAPKKWFAYGPPLPDQVRNVGCDSPHCFFFLASVTLCSFLGLCLFVSLLFLAAFSSGSLRSRPFFFLCLGGPLGWWQKLRSLTGIPSDPSQAPVLLWKLFWLGWRRLIRLIRVEFAHNQPASAIEGKRRSRRATEGNHEPACWPNDCPCVRATHFWVLAFTDG